MATGQGLADSPIQPGWQHYDQRLNQLARSELLAPLRGSTIVVLGAGGMLGTAVMRVLGHIAGVVDTATVPVGVSRSPVRDPAPRTRFISGDTTDPRTYTRLPSPDYVVYIAGPTSEYLSRPWQTIDVTVNGLRRALDYARDSRGLVFVSSTRVYGPYADGDLNEDSHCSVDAMSTLNIYDSSKRLAESMLLVEHRDRSGPGTVVRLTNIYGPYSSNPHSGSLGAMLRQMRERRRVEVTGHPETSRNYCFVSDAVEGLLLALANGARGQAYIVGSDEHYTNAEFAHRVARLVGPDVQVDIAQSAWTAPRSVTRFSIERARRDLGYAPQGALDRCLPFVVDWTLDAMDRV